MKSSLEQLLEQAEEVLAPQPPYLDPWVQRHAGNRLGELEDLYLRKNGWLAFNRALRVFSASRSPDDLNLNRWNDPRLWRDTYGDLAEGVLFFADDIFGGQFCIKDSKIYAFDPETAALEWLADDLEGWATVILDDSDYWTGRPLGAAWQEKNGVLEPTQRLIPTLLFTLQGEYTVDNLTAKDAVTGMQIRGPIAQEIHGLPDGTRIRFVITD
ncbi:SMI1/KNR4 family protein [Nannocystis pusilla]|uniref:SMI1/KNR4 family protein n=1 Tax=Nannocystis pusilla TaxID=889268 RepID=A0ABS7TNH4_9BACT|nr:SMI1/KNR4 family protein [Nannocystis pusilla]MBZ5709636.1 SMI1/KNR4 family protein [Nannocystis pusilla]